MDNDDLADVIVEDVDEVVGGRGPLRNENPQFLTTGTSTVSAFLVNYGWYLLLGSFILYIIYSRFRSRIGSLLSSRQPEVDLHRYDDTDVHKRHEAMEAARRKLQEKYSQEAEIHREEMAAKEEEKRKERIADWDRHKEGKGYRSKNKFKDAPSSDLPSTASSSTNPQKKKKVYKMDDYSPLGGGGSSYRPAPRFGGRGGG